MGWFWTRMNDTVGLGRLVSRVGVLIDSLAEARTDVRWALGGSPGKSSLMLGRETFFGDWGEGDMVVSGREGSGTEEGRL